MTFVKINPKRELLKDAFFPVNFHSLFDSLLEHPSKAEHSGFFSPRTDVAETETSFLLEMALPGMKKEEIHIDLKNDTLTISGERKLVKEENAKKYHRVESTFGSFSRSFTLPETAKKEALEASFTDGILHIVLPKAEETSPKKIEIR